MMSLTGLLEGCVVEVGRVCVCVCVCNFITGCNVVGCLMSLVGLYGTCRFMTGYDVMGGFV